MVAATLKAMAQTEPEAVALALSLVKVGKNFFKTSPNLLKLLKRNKKKCWTTKLHPTFQLYGDEWIMTEFHLKWTLFKWQIMELLLLWSNQKMCVCLRCELTAIAHQNYIYMTKQKSLLGNISSVRYLKKIAWEKWFQREQQQWGVTVKVTGCVCTSESSKVYPALLCPAVMWETTYAVCSMKSDHSRDYFWLTSTLKQHLSLFGCTVNRSTT